MAAVLGTAYGFEPGAGKRKIRFTRFHSAQLEAGDDGLQHVVFVNGSESNYFAAALDQRLHGDHHTLGCSAGDHDVAVRVGRDAVEALQLVRDGAAQHGRTRWIGVLMIAACHGLARQFLEFGRCVIVGKALRQIDSAHLLSLDGGAADNGFAQRETFERSHRLLFSDWASGKAGARSVVSEKNTLKSAAK
jgi:hypothetical protein